MQLITSQHKAIKKRTMKTVDKKFNQKIKPLKQIKTSCENEKGR